MAVKIIFVQEGKELTEGQIKHWATVQLESKSFKSFIKVSMAPKHKPNTILKENFSDSTFLLCATQSERKAL